MGYKKGASKSVQACTWRSRALRTCAWNPLIRPFSRVSQAIIGLVVSTPGLQILMLLPILNLPYINPKGTPESLYMGTISTLGLQVLLLHEQWQFGLGITGSLGRASKEGQAPDVDIAHTLCQTHVLTAPSVGA